MTQIPWLDAPAGARPATESRSADLRAPGAAPQLPRASWWLLALPTWLAACAAWQAWTVGRAVHRGRALAGRARAYEAHPVPRQARVLIVGDSTGVGVGAGSPNESLAGLMAREFPQVQIVNRAACGARVGDAAAQCAPFVRDGERFDLALVLAGGNDVLRLTPPGQLQADADRLLVSLRRVADRVIWMGSANIGSSPVLRGPLAWWMSHLTGRTMRRLQGAAQRHGVEFIDFYGPRRRDVFGRAPERYFACDGLHPSAASYRHCFDELKRQAPLVSLLTRRPVKAWDAAVVHRPAPAAAVRAGAAGLGLR